MSSVNRLRIRQYEIDLPIFLPDATRAGVRTVPSTDLESIGIEALVVNTFHLMRRPGIRVIQKCGGIHSFMNWKRPVMSDSGGFQIYSLIRENPDNGTIRPNEVIFREPGTKEKWRLTPEKCIQLQFQLGSDIIVCLDDCTNPMDSASEQEQSVERTIRWAHRCKSEFNLLLQRSGNPDQHPLIFAVVQGGASEELRKRCSAALVEIGFDGYGFGGWPVTPDGSLLTDLLELVSRSLPPNSLRHALGVGRPDHIVSAAALGYSMFDCTLPTRDARHNRLYLFLPEYVAVAPPPGTVFYEKLYILDNKYHADCLPIDPTCDCPCCRMYSRAYLHHLFKIEDASAERLASLHNLRFYTRLVQNLRAQA